MRTVCDVHFAHDPVRIAYGALSPVDAAGAGGAGIENRRGGVQALDGRLTTGLNGNGRFELAAEIPL